MFKLIDPIPNASKPEAIPDIVTPFRGLYIPSIKSALLDVAKEEALLSIILALESVSKDSIVFVLLDKAYSRASFVCAVQK